MKTKSDECRRCYARIDDGQFIIGNELVERRWRISGEALSPTLLLDKLSGQQWLVPSQSASPLPGPPGPNPGGLKLSTRTGSQTPVEAPSLQAELRGDRPEAITCRFKIFPGAPGVTVQIISLEAGPEARPSLQKHAGPSGIESDRPGQPPDAFSEDICEALTLSSRHLRIVAVDLRDQTDIRDNLLFETQWLSNPMEKITASGNVFWIEDRLTSRGLVLLKHAPLPHARAVSPTADSHFHGGTLHLVGHGVDAAGGEGYPFTTLVYSGGREGRIRALHTLQRCLRPYHPGRDGLLLANTWGDRSRDTRINESFIVQELAAGERLGVDVQQIDDGWQRGVTSNSVNRDSGGVWEGFWSADQAFWMPHPQRLPNGLEPLVADARRRGIRLGLWFAPDSSHDFANWERDAETILRLHRSFDIDYIKVDGVKLRSRTGERNLRRFFDRVLEQSTGKVVFDLDTTAEIRPGYFGMMHVAPIFIENRYTDWRRYYPHATLRNLWLLSHYIDPLRLRIEFLNNARNVEKYGDDPLAPARYPPDYLFAITMVASPLAWCEVSNLPPDYVAQVAPLVKVWKAHRQLLHAGPILPIGESPDGTAWTGFKAGDSQKAMYLLLFRELNNRPTWQVSCPELAGGKFKTELLAGRGRISISETQVQVTLDEPRSFCLARLLPWRTGGIHSAPDV